MENNLVQAGTQAPARTVVGQVKNLLGKENVKQKFQEVLGAKAPQFLASVVNVVNGSDALKKCEPNSIVGSAFIASSFDLPIDSNLGFSALVPYDKSIRGADGRWNKVKVCQFQMMYKGFIQLAIRSGQYSKMHCTEVYEDELKYYNPIFGECEFTDDWSKTTQRNVGMTDKVVGYYARFELKSGFVKELYMSKAEVQAHAMKYSQAYRYDVDKNKSVSRWSTDFDQMGKKTVIKMLLSKWGILSVEMQKAIQDDQKVVDVDGTSDYADNQQEVDEVVNPFENEAIEEKGEVEEIEEFDITE